MRSDKAAHELLNVCEEAYKSHAPLFLESLNFPPDILASFDCAAWRCMLKFGI